MAQSDEPSAEDTTVQPNNMADEVQDRLRTGDWGVEDSRIDHFALFIVDEVPTQLINDTLSRNSENVSGSFWLWLADSYDNLSDFDIEAAPIEGTEPPISSTWTSPFIGKSLEECAAFVRSAPRPPKPLSKRYFAVVEKARYEEDGDIVVCRIVDGEGDGEWEVQGIPCEADCLAHFFGGHHRDTWEERYLDWRENGQGL